MAAGTGEANPRVKCFFEPGTSTCTYVVTDVETKDTMVLDTALEFDPASGKLTHKHCDTVAEYIEAEKLNVKYIGETHVHADHPTGSRYFKNKYPDAQLCIGEHVAQVQEVFAEVFGWDHGTMKLDGSQFDHLWKDGETFKLGNLDGRILHTPGHTPACVTYVLGGDDGAVFTGDTVFMPDMGSARCDFPKGDADALWHSVRDKIFALPDSMRVFVGHDYGPGGRDIKWETTIAEEKASNKHLHMEAKEDDFITWRRERDATLGTPRLLYASLQINLRAGYLPPADAAGRRFFLIPIDFSSTPYVVPDPHY